MTDRSLQLDTFLAQSPWANWQRHSLAGDASARRYERLTNRNKSVIVMDAPPQNGEDTRPFARIGHFLLEQGLTTPDILAHDPQMGFMVLSDLGIDDFATWLTTAPTDGDLLYRAATDVLIRLHHIAPPPGLQKLTPEVGGEMLKILCPHYTETAIDDIFREMTLALETHAPNATTLALRDFHAENLIWRGNETDHMRVGLLDFQDALIAPAGYDLISLLRDARRDVSPKLAADMIRYFTEKTGAGPAFGAQLATLGAQRNLRILGVFAKLSKAGKPRYLALMPRVWQNLMHDLDHPTLATLKSAVCDTLKAPST